MAAVVVTTAARCAWECEHRGKWRAGKQRAQESCFAVRLGSEVTERPPTCAVQSVPIPACVTFTLIARPRIHTGGVGVACVPATSYRGRCFVSTEKQQYIGEAREAGDESAHRSIPSGASQRRDGEARGWRTSPHRFGPHVATANFNSLQQCSSTTSFEKPTYQSVARGPTTVCRMVASWWCVVGNSLRVHLGG